jgi:hypothetical protein
MERKSLGSSGAAGECAMILRSRDVVRWCFVVVACIASAGTPAFPDSIQLDVDKGSVAGDVDLAWTGGAAPFGVFRSTDPAAVTDPMHWIATTDQSDWTDSPPPDSILFYRVTECPNCTACGLPPGVTPPGGRLSVAVGGSDNTGSCGGSGPEGIFMFTLSSPSDVFLTTQAVASLDTVLYVRQGDCTGPEVACNDDADGRTASTLLLPNLAAGTYTVFVDTKAAFTGSIPVDVYMTAPSALSDRCGRPGFLPAGSTALTGDTCGFGSDYAPTAMSDCTDPQAGAAEDRVYYFYLPASGPVTLSGCTSGSDYDQVVYIRSVCTDPSSSAQEACNDNGCGGPQTCSGALRSALTVTLPAGLYYLFVDGYAGGVCPCGSYTFSVGGL